MDDAHKEENIGNQLMNLKNQGNNEGYFKEPVRYDK